MGKREQARQGVWLRTASLGLLLAAGAFFMAWGLTEPAGELEGALPEARLQPLTQAQAGEEEGEREETVKLLRGDGRIEELPLETYLWGVVAAEMPASFEPEALKAQAVAARTYTRRVQSASPPRHGEAELCDESTCCQAYIDRRDAEGRWGLQARSYGEKLDRALAETRGLLVLYQGEPIQAVFFSSAKERTADAAEVWGSAVDYLRSVESPEGEEVPNYHSEVFLSPEELRERVLAQYPQASFQGEPASWCSQPRYTPSGRVSELRLGDVTLTGAEARALLGLRSASFSVAYEEGGFRFSVTGYGHGVGMSQYGANALAKEGKSFDEILAWYYQDTQLGTWETVSS